MNTPASQCWAVVPVKAVSSAKQRLARLLSEAERAELVRCMLTDVLVALSGATRIAGTLVVTRDPALTALAASHGASVLAESRPGLSAAVGEAAGRLAARGIAAMLALPADLPLLSGAAIDDLVASHRGGITVATDAARDGTNALLCNPPGAIDFHYGPGSCRAHMAAAAARGVPARCLTVPALALDIDTPADLADLVRAAAGGASHAWLVSHGIAARLQAEHAQATA